MGRAKIVGRDLVIGLRGGLCQCTCIFQFIEKSRSFIRNNMSSRLWLIPSYDVLDAD